MMVLYVPQVNTDSLDYSFDGEVVSVTLNDVKEEFDLSVIRVGDEFKGIESELDINVIYTLERRLDGKIYIELIKYISEDAPYDECFPDWIEV